jgi:hypothetical protein
MRTLHDQFAKQVLQLLLEPAGTVSVEQEVAPAAQKIELWASFIVPATWSSASDPSGREERERPATSSSLGRNDGQARAVLRGQRKLPQALGSPVRTLTRAEPSC